MNLSLAGYLLIAVVVLGAGNVFTGIKWMRASAEGRAACYERMVEAASIAIAQERKQESAADAAAQQVKASVQSALAEGRGDADQLQHGIRVVRVSDDCAWPDGLPSVQPAIDAANAAFGD